MSGIEEYKRLNSRKASIVHVGGFRPTSDPLASHFCLKPVARPDEPWASHDGKPLLFVCQLNLTAALIVPDLLKDIALVTFFVDPDVGGWSDENGQGWCLRAYKTVEGLTPMNRPVEAPKTKRGFECRWEECLDFARFDDPDVVVPDGFDASDVHLDNVHRTKIGGYASNIQSEPWWGFRRHAAEPKYCLQIDSELKVDLIWGDAGTIFLARGTTAGFKDAWFLDWQCY